MTHNPFARRALRSSHLVAGGTLSRLVGAFFVGALVLLTTMAVPAAAHGDLEGGNPEPGSTVRKKVDHVAINFTERPSENAGIEVFDGCGEDIVDEAYVQERTLHVVLTKVGAPGRWRVVYEVISAEDGHKTNGEYGFTVKGKRDCGGNGDDDPVAPDETAEPSEDGSDDEPGGTASDDGAPIGDEGSSFPTFLLAVGALALIGIAVLVRVGGASK